MSSRKAPGNFTKFPRIHTHKGKLCENLCQALSRDIFGWQITQAYKEGIPCLFTVHDEGIPEQPDDKVEWAAERVTYWMTQSPPWMPELPLGCDCGIFNRYEKG